MVTKMLSSLSAVILLYIFQALSSTSKVKTTLQLPSMLSTEDGGPTKAKEEEETDEETKVKRRRGRPKLVANTMTQKKAKLAKYLADVGINYDSFRACHYEVAACKKSAACAIGGFLKFKEWLLKAWDGMKSDLPDDLGFDECCGCQKCFEKFGFSVKALHDVMQAEEEAKDSKADAAPMEEEQEEETLKVDTGEKEEGEVAKVDSVQAAKDMHPLLTVLKANTVFRILPVRCNACNGAGRNKAFKPGKVFDLQIQSSMAWLESHLSGPRHKMYEKKFWADRQELPNVKTEVGTQGLEDVSTVKSFAQSCPGFELKQHILTTRLGACWKSFESYISYVAQGSGLLTFQHKYAISPVGDNFVRHKACLKLGW